LKAHVSCKAGEMVEHMKHIHETVQKHIEDSNQKYKERVDKGRRRIVFKVGDNVWVVLTQDPTSEYNKLNARKIGPCELLERLNDNAYRLKLPSHIKTPDIFFDKYDIFNV
jgi:methylmalonyl-CoA mutase N-terminal domain/subunit